MLLLDKSKLHNFRFELKKAWWVVKLVSPSHKELNFDGLQACGLTQYHKRTILLDKSLDAYSTASTFWHEIFHAATGENIGSSADEKNQIDQEIAANLVGSAMPEILPQILHLLIEENNGQEGSSESPQQDSSTGSKRSRANRDK
jgi:hypothetical protein